MVTRLDKVNVGEGSEVGGQRTTEDTRQGSHSQGQVQGTTPVWKTTL